MTKDGNNNSNTSKQKGGRGRIFNRRMKDEQRSNGLLQPMLSGQQRLLGSSEGDINKNMSLSSTSSPSLLVDGNNNSNSSENLKGDEDLVNIPVDRRQSSVEPLQRHHIGEGEDLELQLLINERRAHGVGAEIGFEDIDGSPTEDVEEHGGQGDRSSSPVTSSENALKDLPPSTPVSLCSSN